MVAFYASVIITALMVAVVLRVAKTRQPGTPITWGEAFAGGTFVFFLMFMIYGVVPHQWLAYADNQLGWRPDKAGIPTGPIGELHLFGKQIIHHHILWGSPKDISLLGFLGSGRGKIQIHAQILRDIIACLIYGVALGGNIGMMLWWQKRKPNAEKSAKTVAVTESAFGRPVVQQG